MIRFFLRSFFIAIGMPVFAARPVFAQCAADDPTCVDLNTQETNPLFGLTIPLLLCNLAEAIFFLAIAAAVLAFLIAAFRYFSSQGKEQEMTGAKNALTYAVYGVAAALLAWGAAFIIASLLSGGAASLTNPCASAS